MTSDAWASSHEPNRLGSIFEGDDTTLDSSDEEEDDVWPNIDRIMSRDHTPGFESLTVPSHHRGHSGLEDWPDSWQEAYLRTGLTPIAESLHSYSTDWNESRSRESLVDSGPPTLPGSPSGESRYSGSSSGPQSLRGSVRPSFSPTSTSTRHSLSSGVKSPTSDDDNRLDLSGKSRNPVKSRASSSSPVVSPVPGLSTSDSPAALTLSSRKTLEQQLDVPRSLSPEGAMSSSSPNGMQSPPPFSALSPSSREGTASPKLLGMQRSNSMPLEIFNGSTATSPRLSPSASGPPTPTIWTAATKDQRNGSDIPIIAHHLRSRSSAGGESASELTLTPSGRRASESSWTASSIGPNASASVVDTTPASLAPQQLSPVIGNNQQPQQQQQPLTLAPPGTSHLTNRPSQKRRSRNGSRNTILAGISSVSVSLQQKANHVPAQQPAKTVAPPQLNVPSEADQSSSEWNPLPTSPTSPTSLSSTRVSGGSAGRPRSTTSSKSGSHSQGSAGSQTGSAAAGSSAMGSGSVSSSSRSIDQTLHQSSAEDTSVSTSSGDILTSIMSQNSGDDDQGGAVTPRARTQSPDLTMQAIAQEPRQRYTSSTGASHDATTKVPNSTPAPQVITTSFESRPQSVRSSVRSSDILPCESLETLSDQSHQSWSQVASGGIVDAPQSRTELVFSTKTSATLSALNALADRKDQTLSSDAQLDPPLTPLAHKRSSPVIDVLNAASRSDLMVVRYLLSWGPDVHTAFVLKSVPPAEILPGGIDLDDRHSGPVNSEPTKKGTTSSISPVQLPTRADWTVHRSDGRKEFHWCGYIMACATTLLALLSIKIPTRLSEGPRTKPQPPHHSVHQDPSTAGSGSGDGNPSNRSLNSNHSNRSSSSKVCKSPRGWQGRNVGSLGLLSLYASSLPLSGALSQTIGAIYRWDNFSLTALAFLVRLLLFPHCTGQTLA